MNKISKLIAPCVSLLCLVHCVGMALISLLAPTLLVFQHSEVVEISVVVINFLFGNWSLYNMNQNKNKFILLNSLILISALALVFHEEVVLHISILLMAALQLKLLIDHRRSKKVTCCEHKH